MRISIGTCLAGLGLTVGLVSPAPAQQQEDWQNRWYWGGQGGAFFFETPTVGNDVAYTVGGHWMITGTRSALYLAFDQVEFPDGTTSRVPDAASATGSSTVAFSSGRRIQGILYAMPNKGALQLYLGGGFTINQITDAAATGATSVALDETIDEFSTRAFAVFSAGAQLRIGRLALFGHYQYMPSADDFLLSSEQHALSGGLRLSITGSHEAITTDR